MASSSSQPTRDKTKKRNAPLSCAECRRLKLRCSRVFPCASCVRKGVAAICPDGSLTTGKGNRFVLANTEALHEKISALATRVRELEDALQEVHGERSKTPHPLLSSELLQIKRPLEREASEAPREQEVDPAEAIDVGSLAISESGHTNFFGATANAWYLLLQNEEGSDDEAEDSQISLPVDLPWLNHAFPLSTIATESVGNVRSAVSSFLPEPVKARRLADLYFRHAAWMYTPVPESEFFGVVIPRVYDQTLPVDQDPIDSHYLAIAFLVFAIGTLLDLDRPALSPEATQYYQLGRAALSLDSILEFQSIPAIQALLLMCHFMFLSFIDGPRWALMGLAVKLAQSVGLHRDSDRWNLSPEETTKRRSLMWELYTYDSWQSLTFGRPPSFSMAYIDCQMIEEPTKNEEGEIEMSFDAWKHRFASRCLSVVHEQAFGARAASYKAIQELEKKVRHFYFPPSLRVPGFSGAKIEMNAPPPTIQLTMQRYTAFAIKEITILYLHRGFFAKAIEDHPEDPLGSKYAPSFLAAYNSASSFAGLVRSLYSQHPGLTERMWFLFTHVFSCAIILGSIPTRCPSMTLARSALSHLDSVCSLFEDVSQNARAAKVVPVLRKLKARAMLAMSDQQPSRVPPDCRLSPDHPSSKEDEELAALGGKTRLVSRKSPSAPSVPSSPQGYTAPTLTETLMDHAPAAVPVATDISHHTIPNSPHNQPAPSIWHSYPQSHPGVYDYSPYAHEQEQWQTSATYQQADSPTPQMDIMPATYDSYGHPAGGSYSSIQPTMDSPIQHRDLHMDPETSWRSLLAQFNSL